MMLGTDMDPATARAQKKEKALAYAQSLRSQIASKPADLSAPSSASSSAAARRARAQAASAASGGNSYDNEEEEIGGFRGMGGGRQQQSAASRAAQKSSVENEIKREEYERKKDKQAQYKEELDRQIQESRRNKDVTAKIGRSSDIGENKTNLTNRPW